MQGKTECSSKNTYQHMHCSTAALKAITAATVELSLLTSAVLNRTCTATKSRQNLLRLPVRFLPNQRT